MADITVPVIKFDQEKTQTIVERLYQVRAESPKDLRCKDFTLEDGQVLTSWTMKESVYKKKSETFPTMARGIFTKKIDGDYHVKVRGYDKFFNTLETAATQVSFK